MRSGVLKSGIIKLCITGSIIKFYIIKIASLENINKRRFCFSARCMRLRSRWTPGLEGWFSMFVRKKRFKKLTDKIDKLVMDMEKSRIREYVCYLENPKKVFFSNFLAGLARGFGASIGFTLLAAVLLYVLQKIVRWNLPIIGDFINEIARIVENNLRSTRR